MKALISACALCGLIWLPAAGQGGGGSHPGFIHAGGPARTAVPAGQAGTVGIPPLGLLPPMGTTTSPTLARRGFRQGERGFGRGQGFGYWYPVSYDDYYQGDYAPYQASPSMVVVMPDAQPAPPPRIVQGEVHDYTKTSPPETEQGPPAEFSIVGKDHVAHPAVAAWAQDGTLYYLDADGAGGKMPLGAVDREATRQANSAKGLRLQVSAE